MKVETIKITDVPNITVRGSKQMEEQQSEINNWREDVSESSAATLKIQDGEEATFVFLNEGEKRTHNEYGTSIVFDVECEQETKAFYVRETNYAFLSQIKALGLLTGKAVKVSRTGSKRSDTRYTLEEINLAEEEKTEEPKE